MTDAQTLQLSKIARRLLTDINCVANNPPPDEWIEQQQLQFVLEALEDGARVLRSESTLLGQLTPLTGLDGTDIHIAAVLPETPMQTAARLYDELSRFTNCCAGHVRCQCSAPIPAALTDHGR